MREYVVVYSITTEDVEKLLEAHYTSIMLIEKYISNNTNKDMDYHCHITMGNPHTLKIVISYDTETAKGSG